MTQTFLREAPLNNRFFFTFDNKHYKKQKKTFHL